MSQTLEELIDQQIELGHKNPHEFPDLLRQALGDELLTIITPHIDEFIAELGRHRINAMRRRSVARITPTSLGDPQIMLRSMWIPSGNGTITYKRIADMTADDFDARADYLERLAGGILNHAQWCRDTAQLIRDSGVDTAGKLTHLPGLHDLNA